MIRKDSYDILSLQSPQLRILGGTVEPLTLGGTVEPLTSDTSVRSIEPAEPRLHALPNRAAAP